MCADRAAGIHAAIPIELFLRLREECGAALHSALLSADLAHGAAIRRAITRCHVHACGLPVPVHFHIIENRIDALDNHNDRDNDRDEERNDFPSIGIRLLLSAATAHVLHFGNALRDFTGMFLSGVFHHVYVWEVIGLL